MDDINKDDVVKQDYYCPRCNLKMMEKRPKKDKHVIVHKDQVVRLSCVCGYYRDEVLNPEDFKDL